MIESPSITQWEECQTAVIHLQMKRQEMDDYLLPAIDEIIAVLTAQGSAPAGPLFTYHRENSMTHFNLEVGFAVTQAIAPAGRVYNSTLPKTKVAQCYYYGAYEALYGAWKELGEQIQSLGLLEKNQLKRCDGAWEVYEKGPESSQDPSLWKTQLNLALCEAESNA